MTEKVWSLTCDSLTDGVVSVIDWVTCWVICTLFEPVSLVCVTFASWDAV